MSRPSDGLGDALGGLPLWRRLRAAPRLADPRRAKARLAEFLATPDAEELRALASEARVGALLEALADHSPFLWRLATADPARVTRCFREPPEERLAACLAALDQACDEAADEACVMRALRRAKQESALLIALADLGGVFDVDAATRALSRAAEAFISAALRFLLSEAHHAGALRLPDLAAPETGCGLVILGLGKLGAHELNYSSDVDLVVLFDPQSAVVAGAADPATSFVRLTKKLVKLLQERTADSYVLRVDLRLRPDPGSTAVAVAVPAACAYYEIVGQNWERAAFIKARPIAGDMALGESFIATLSPFIWRKYFDYAAIADIHAMKRQIHAVRGHAEIKVAGHDVKLGRGGIREIEFFVQTQQLIFGGKRPRLRGGRTLDMLAELGCDGWVTQEAVADLSAAYVFLREVEHRLQMRDDEQTQRLPEGEPLTRFARFCGFAREQGFHDALLNHLDRVSHHYALLFENAPGLDASVGSLVFTGAGDDPETLRTLTRLGFKKPALAAETVRGWHFGRRPAVQSPRAREVITELVPGLLQAFSRSGDPDTALAGFDSALARMPAAIELFSMLKSDPRMLQLFGDLLGAAPRLARMAISRPHLLDATIAPGFLDAPTDEEAFDARAAPLLEAQFGMEEFLDAARDFAQEEHFLIGLRLLSGAIAPETAARAYSALAAAVVRVCLFYVERAFVAEHGRAPGGRCVVLGLGKLGSREMTAASDLDLILIYDFDRARPETDGKRPVHAVQYYTRLAQRLISALTSATKRGRLYEVDMRLRPSGRKGPVATQFDSFVDYQSKEAETWEHMALTRARVVAGDPGLGAEAAAAIRAVLMRPRGEALPREVREMRSLVARVKGESEPWDLKLAAGGLMDIEFLAQFLLLRHACRTPELICVSTCGVIEAAGQFGFLETGDAQVLTEAHRLLTNVTQMLRLTLDEGADPRTASEGVKRRLAAAAQLPSLDALEAELGETRAGVRAIFNRVLGGAGA
ncbi:bifunctional [glutamine synthetase] adenylyltransferase/[glutamine synthetase]-adenylyl-L-tyrosine phosphorylase [Methylocapsa acidiphila]|uniref:bifunctional [glutamine synthetase] adenylyltransferase/[glutamine synthetase]-adenylyl-L-tyrosine phosphorylase n=1 Tax=Methylocapsa acidiphila TaxID=133552 RepID=UPI000688C2A9|nr:bifunctional [glutamine synthetase] adenylyltransferase/[glutamine synthetase]-adenylyl-L-tyrosine phosphorylase [Methylocapsa acidiphila]